MEFGMEEVCFEDALQSVVQGQLDRDNKAVRGLEIN
jgi:hypothetical protein